MSQYHDSKNGRAAAVTSVALGRSRRRKARLSHRAASSPGPPSARPLCRIHAARRRAFVSRLRSFHPPTSRRFSGVTRASRRTTRRASRRARWRRWLRVSPDAFQRLVHLSPPPFRVWFPREHILQRMHQVAQAGHGVPVLRDSVSPRGGGVLGVSRQQFPARRAWIRRLAEDVRVRRREHTPRVRVRGAAHHAPHERAFVRFQFPSFIRFRAVPPRNRGGFGEGRHAAVERESDVGEVPRQRVHPLVSQGGPFGSPRG